MEVRFRRPARIDSRLYCEAKVGGRRHGRLIEAEGEIRDQAGRLIATARSRFMIMPQSQIEGFVGRIRAVSDSGETTGIMSDVL